MRPAPRKPFSWKKDPAVPPFDEGRILLVMDGECALCSAAARWIAARDEGDRVRITPCASPLGTALLRHYGFDPADPGSWLMLEAGRAHGSLDAMLLLGARLRPWLRVFGVARLLPVPAQDWLYARLARNRYALFGKGDLCALPTEALRRRLVE